MAARLIDWVHTDNWDARFSHFLPRERSFFADAAHRGGDRVSDRVMQIDILVRGIQIFVCRCIPDSISRNTCPDTCGHIRCFGGHLSKVRVVDL